MPYTNEITNAATATAKRAAAITAVFPGGWPREIGNIEVGDSPVVNVAATFSVLRVGTRYVGYWRANSGTRDKLLLVSQGHGTTANGMEGLGVGNLIRAACLAGIDVLGFAMPGGDGVWNGGGGGGEHTGTPLGDFVRPAIVAINHALAAHAYTLVGMAGVSGGGWTTVLAAALDARIQKSIDVAGSYPLWIAAPRDYEQTHSLWGSTLTYEEAYTLGAAGGERVQVLNPFDPVGFVGDGRHSQYESQVAAIADALGGVFRVVIDSSTATHQISSATINNVILPMFGETGVITIIDNGDAGFSTVGTWAVWSGYQGDTHQAAAGNGSNVATWNFSGLQPGYYRVSATWPPHTNRATNSPFSVLQGGQLLGTVTVNQQLAPNDFSDAGASWEDLGGPYGITGSSLEVRLTNAANGYVHADAIRIERIGDLPPPPSGDDISRAAVLALLDSWAAADAATSAARREAIEGL